MKPERILITGSAGCLAFPLANGLVADGRTVIGLDILQPRQTPAFTSLVGDVGDPHLLHRLLAEHRIDAIVHCGGLSGQMVAPDDPYRNCQVNVFGTVHLLEAARLHGVDRFIYCSSHGAYGEVDVACITEEAAFEPVTTYGATKAACDLILRSYAIQYGLNATSLRIGRVYGPGRRTDSIVSDMVRAALLGHPLELPAGGIALQYVYEADVSDALRLALDSPRLPATSYNIAGPGLHTDEDIAARIEALVPGSAIRFDDRPRKAASVPRSPMDYRAAQADFGYSPRFDIDRGLRAFIDAWTRSHAC